AARWSERTTRGCDPTGMSPAPTAVDFAGAPRADSLTTNGTRTPRRMDGNGSRTARRHGDPPRPAHGRIPHERGSGRGRGGTRPPCRCLAGACGRHAGAQRLLRALVAAAGDATAAEGHSAAPGIHLRRVARRAAVVRILSPDAGCE